MEETNTTQQGNLDDMSVASIVDCLSLVLELAWQSALSSSLGKEAEFNELYLQEQHALERVTRFCMEIKKIEDSENG